MISESSSSLLFLRDTIFEGLTVPSEYNKHALKSIQSSLSDAILIVSSIVVPFPTTENTDALFFLAYILYPVTVTPSSVLLSVMLSWILFSSLAYSAFNSTVSSYDFISL